MDEPKSKTIGETVPEVRQKNSKFTTFLKTLNLKTDYLAFIVPPDSFAAFCAVRKQAWDRGFDVGWEPHPSEILIVFGSGGRAIGVQ